MQPPRGIAITRHCNYELVITTEAQASGSGDMDSDVDELRVSEQDADPLDLLALEWRGSGSHKCALIVCVRVLHRQGRTRGAKRASKLAKAQINEPKML